MQKLHCLRKKTFTSIQYIERTKEKGSNFNENVVLVFVEFRFTLHYERDGTVVFNVMEISPNRYSRFLSIFSLHLCRFDIWIEIDNQCGRV